MKNDPSLRAVPEEEGQTPSLLLDACERLRYDLLSFVASRASSGPPVFGPALLFLEDPREGVLRPATNVTWDDLRLAPLLDNLLSGCLTRLSALYSVLKGSENVGSVAINRYSEHHRNYNGLPERLSRHELAKNAQRARNAVIKVIKESSSQALDKIFSDDQSEILKLQKLAQYHLEPMLGPLARLPRESAIALGVSPETRLIEEDSISGTFSILAGIAQNRLTAWMHLREILSNLSKEESDYYKRALASAAGAIVQTEGSAALIERFTQLRDNPDDSPEALRAAIRLFQISPQEIGSSLAYLRLQYRNARSYLREHLSYEHNLITTTYSQRMYRYDDDFVNNWPLYKITQRLERLFYGGTEERGSDATIRNITFIPVSYFPGQIIGQVVMSTPIALDVPSLIDFSQYYIREIRTAATAEFISLIQRSLQRMQHAGKIDHNAVLKAVAESLTTILSVQSLSAFVRTKICPKNESRYKKVFAVAREECAQPHDLVNAYLNLGLENDLQYVWPEFKIKAAEMSLDLFLSTGMRKIGISAHRLTDRTIQFAGGDSARLDQFFEQQNTERVFVVANRIHADRKSDDWIDDQGSINEHILPTLRGITGAKHNSNDSFLLLRLPLSNNEAADQALEAVFIARLWEPASAVKNMTLSVLHTVWNGIRSCRALIDMAGTAAVIAGAKDIAHNVAAPIGMVNAFFEEDILRALDRVPEDMQDVLKDAHALLTTVGLMAESVKRRALPAAMHEREKEDIGQCEVLDAIRRVSNRRILSRFWKRQTIEIQQTLLPEALSSTMVRGSLDDWIIILYTFLKNAYEATLLAVPTGPAYVRLTVKLKEAFRGKERSLEIVIENQGTIMEHTRSAMIRCLNGTQKIMPSQSNKGMGVGLALAGERLRELEIDSQVVSTDGMVRVILSKIKMPED